jgi:2-polyprenyl-3-methyl-5-hydroxy-6-metoxy-1,4-benzoquinol methylase
VERKKSCSQVGCTGKEENMERAKWLKQMQAMTEAIYDHISPQYWVSFGLYENETHLEFLQKFLDRLPPHSTLLSAACGAGRYDGILLEAGHQVMGIDQSDGMLERARGHFPQVHYEKMALQEINFHEQFEGAICLDAMEHICPEDWPGILQGFQRALKPGGWLYLTVEVPDPEEVKASYERSRSMGLPVLYGEVADNVEESYKQVKTLHSSDVKPDIADVAVYHYHPSHDQVRTWLEEAGLSLDEGGTGHWYDHLIIRKI